MSSDPSPGPLCADHAPLRCAVDVGSTTCKYVLYDASGKMLARDYERHHTRPGEKVLEFLRHLESRFGLTLGRDVLFLTGSGAGFIASMVGARVIQEVVAVAAAVEKLHPGVRFVSEIGGEDMKTVFLRPSGKVTNKQVFMQNACSGGTGAFIEKIARKLEIPLNTLATLPYDGSALHRISSKCGIFAEIDANTLLKAAVPVEEIIASLFDAVVHQNLASLTKGNTPLPEVLLLGGPNLFYRGLHEAWRYHLGRIWREREVALPRGKSAADLVHIPELALYYAAIGCVAVAEQGAPAEPGYRGTKDLRRWLERGQSVDRGKEARAGLWRTSHELAAFRKRHGENPEHGRSISSPGRATPVVVGCDFGSATAKATCLTLGKELSFSCYTLSRGNPLEDAKVLFARIREVVDDGEIRAVGVTGYGKDLLKDVIGADVAVVETVAHATAGLHFFPDADCICDVGGTDVKIMLLRNGSVYDFRLNSQCSSGNGAFLQGVAERFGIALGDIAERAFEARAMPQLAMGCGVFLQSDIVNQQRKGWLPEEILAGLCAVLPRNVWLYAGGLNNLAQVGKKFVLQGGTHRNLAVVKAQVDFIRTKVPDAEVFVHPYCGEAGAIGAALVANEYLKAGEATRFAGFDTVANLQFETTTSPQTRCPWCELHCQRTFVDVRLPGASGRPKSKVPLSPGWERIIVNNSCARGLSEDPREVKEVNESFKTADAAYPNVGHAAKRLGFRRRASR